MSPTSPLIVLLFGLTLQLGGCADSSSQTPSARGGSGGASGAAGSNGTALAAGTLEGGQAGGENTDPLPLPESVTLHGACALDDELGGFDLVTDEALELTTLSGTVKDGVDPAQVPEVVADDGVCRLLRREVFFCEPPCASGSTCGSDGSCVAMSRAQDLGDVRLDGWQRGLLMAPLQPGNLYSSELDFPGVEPGTLVRLRTTTGYAGETECFGFGVEPLKLLTGRWLLTAGRALNIRWIAPAAETRSAITLSLSVDQHGTTPLRLHCQSEDDGELEIPAEVIDTLLDAGLTGFPSAALDRNTTDSVALDDGCMHFRVSSVRKPDVAISGYTPCSSQGQCQTGETCNLALERCE